MNNIDSQTIVEMRNITKQFGRVVALEDVNFTLAENEIHGLVGDNGSGKSTLIKVLVGVHQPDEGSTFIRGERVSFNSPREARQHGIATVYQDLALVDDLTVGANMFLGRKPTRKIGPFEVIDWKSINKRAQSILQERLDINLDPTQRVEFLSGGERQSIAIARALVTDPEIVIMDEPTSALSADAVPRVHQLIRTLKEEGISVIVISHNIEEVFSLTDRITVLDNAKKVGTVETDMTTSDDILRMIIEGKSDHVQAAVEAS